MQPKESKTNRHFWFSMVKSCLRLGAGILLMTIPFTTEPYTLLAFTGVLLFVAEILGVCEEL